MTTVLDEPTRAARLLEAQDKAVELFDEVVARELLRPGASEIEVSRAVRDLAAELHGVTRHWHKRIVRSGPNTLLPYAENPPDRVIEADDIAFVDLGPIYEHWEADVGRTFVLGDDPHKLRLQADLARVWQAGRAFYESRPDITGAELYAEVVRLAAETPWTPGHVHAGHLLGEFPHEQLDGEKLDSYIAPGSDLPMRRPLPDGRAPHWVLEIHLVDAAQQIGGFYEQLLTV